LAQILILFIIWFWKNNIQIQNFL